MYRFFISIVILILAVTSCTDGREYTGYKNISIQGWSYSDNCDYVVITGDSVSSRYLLVAITHDNSYEYSNLWLEVSYEDNLAQRHVDTVNVHMCDSYGNWYGKGLPGHYQLTDTLVKHRVSLKDSAKVTVRHIMRVDTLTGISQVGIRF